MALDIAHILLRIEDDFSISVWEGEAESARTVEDLCQMVLNKMGSRSDLVSSKVSYRIRRAVAETLKLERRSIHPGTWLEPLLPRETRAAQWKAIGDCCGLELPDLEHPRRWRDSFMVLSMVAAAVPVAALWWSLYEIGWLPGIARWLFIFPALVAWVVLVSRINRKLLKATPGLRYEIPCATAEVLAEAVLALNLDGLESESAGAIPPAKEQVRNRVVEIVCEELRITPQDVTPETRITDGLGVR